MKNTISIILLATHISTAWAINIQDATSGKSVYIDKWFNDEKVIIIERNYNNNTVKIMRENGESAWVNADVLVSELYVKIEDEIEEYVIQETLKWFFAPSKK